jgi:AcrR family transcriptional regulator
MPTGRATVKDRKAREPLTRDRIVDAALRLMDAEGLEAVTMRRLGRELGVEAMSLYNHVADKDDILDGIVDRVMGEFRYPDPHADWAERAWTSAQEWRRLLKAHPNVIRLLVEREKPLASAATLGPMELALSLLKEAGLSDGDAVQAFRSLGGYIMGAVTMEVGNLAPGGHAHDPAQLQEHLARLPADQLPTLASLMVELHECDDDATFDFGLGLLLAGIQARTGAGDPAGPRDTEPS